MPRGGVYPGWLHQLIATDPTTTAAPGEHDPDAAVYPTTPNRWPGGQLILRLPPGHHLLAAVLTRLRACARGSQISLT